jgi:hypothetical protein
MSNKQRTLKVLPKYFPRRWKEVVFPEIRLAGKWLQITLSENSITITTMSELKATPHPPKKNAHKVKPVFSYELDNLPGDQLFRFLSTEEYRAYVAKMKEEKRRRKKVGIARGWEDFKKKHLKAKENKSSGDQGLASQQSPDQAAE